MGNVLVVNKGVTVVVVLPIVVGTEDVAVVASDTLAEVEFTEIVVEDLLGAVVLVNAADVDVVVDVDVDVVVDVDVEDNVVFFVDVVVAVLVEDIEVTKVVDVEVFNDVVAVTMGAGLVVLVDNVAAVVVVLK